MPFKLEGQTVPGNYPWKKKIFRNMEKIPRVNDWFVSICWLLVRQGQVPTPRIAQSFRVGDYLLETALWQQLKQTAR
jgi:hypothetical protein